MPTSGGLRPQIPRALRADTLGFEAWQGLRELAQNPIVTRALQRWPETLLATQAVRMRLGDESQRQRPGRKHEGAPPVELAAPGAAEPAPVGLSERVDLFS